MSHVPYDPYSTGAIEMAQLRKWSWLWWHLAVIQARKRLGQKDHSQVSVKLLQEVHEVQDSLGCIARTCINNENKRDRDQFSTGLGWDSGEGINEIRVCG